MPTNREPTVYTGFVISTIGANRGERVPMEWKVAQSNVAAGQALWEDDESTFDRQLKTDIEARAAEKLRLEKEARINSQKPSLEDAMWAARRVIHVAVDEKAGEDGAEPTVTRFLARPFPEVTSFPVDRIDNIEGLSVDGERALVAFANANAIYKLGVERDGEVVLSLEEADQPDVGALNEKWREQSGLSLTRIAKEIRRSTDKMTKEQAVPIIEEWIKQDDQGSVSDGQPRGGQDNKRVLDGNHEPDGGGFKDADGNSITAEERARQAAAEFVNQD